MSACASRSTSPSPATRWRRSCSRTRPLKSVCSECSEVQMRVFLRHGVSVLIGVLVACSSPRPQVGGETHWLRSCWSDAECGGALACICGSCTRTCHEDDRCEGGRPAACYEQDSPLLLQRCAGTSPDVQAAAGVCLPLCASDEQCSGGKRCEQGACVPAEPAADAGSAPSKKPQIDDYDDVTVDLPSTDAVQLPELSTQIVG